MKSIKYILIILFLTTSALANIYSQEVKKNITEMTREDVLGLTYDELLEMPFEDLLKLAEIVGVSLDELYEMILNKDVTSASKKEESSFDSPLSTSVLSYDDIKKSGATCIEEALRLIPGLIVREKTNGNYDVHIRGNDNVPPGNMLLYSENSMTLVMIDNRVVYNYAHGGAFWETLPVGLEDIDRIEVIRGPASALYGPNAVTGVIHIITKKFENEKKHLNFDAQVGTRNSKIVSLNTGAKIGDKFGINVSGNYQYRDRFQEEFYLWERDIYVPRDSLSTIIIPSSVPPKPYETRSLEERFPNPNLGRENYGLTSSLYYNFNEDLKLNLSAGYQNSNSITTPLDNPYYSLTRRTSESKYVDFKSFAYGFNFQLSYLYGPQNVGVDVQGMQYDFRTLDAVFEYEYKFKNLDIRPGISYRQANYDDGDYVDITLKEGFLNGDRKLSTFSYGIRADYLAFDKLRLIGALRADKYNYPDKTYFTYQAIASYNINNKHLVRAVYSRANRSPFMVDVYANFDWQRVDPIPYFLPDGGHFYFEGNKNLKLATMDMFELGYRVKPVKMVQIDLEAFYNRTTNFDWFQLDTINLLILNTYMIVNSSLVSQNQVPYNAVFSYSNLDIVSKQVGISFDINTVINEKLYFSLFGTLQSTKLENYNPLNVTESIQAMAGEAAGNFRFIALPDSMINFPMAGLKTYGYRFGGSYQPDSSIKVDHKSTPTFYGGIKLNYTPVPKINFNTNIYFYTNQILVHSFESKNIDAKVIINTKLSYKFWKENSVYINARNLLNNKTKEFAFVDNIGGMYLLGLEMKF